jgi:hypothetical protein
MSKIFLPIKRGVLMEGLPEIAIRGMGMRMGILISGSGNVPSLNVFVLWVG